MSGMSRNPVVKVSITITALLCAAASRRGEGSTCRGMMTWEDLVEPIYQDVIEITKVGRWSEIRIVP